MPKPKGDLREEVLDWLIDDLMKIETAEEITANNDEYNKALLQAKSQPFLQINRYLIILTPKERMIEWLNKTEKIQIQTHYVYRKSNRRAYLIFCDDNEAIKKKIKAKRSDFINQVTNEYPRETWAWAPNKEEFNEWFNVTIIKELFDVETKEIEKEINEDAIISSQLFDE